MEINEVKMIERLLSIIGHRNMLLNGIPKEIDYSQMTRRTEVDYKIPTAEMKLNRKTVDDLDGLLSIINRPNFYNLAYIAENKNHLSFDFPKEIFFFEIHIAKNEESDE